MIADAEQILADIAEHTPVMTANDEFLADLAAILAALALAAQEPDAVAGVAASVRRWVVAKNFAGQMRLVRRA